MTNFGLSLKWIFQIASVRKVECFGWLHLPTNFNKYIVGKVIRLLFIIIVRALQNSTRGRFQLQLKHHHPDLFLKRSFRLCCNFGQHHYYTSLLTLHPNPLWCCWNGSAEELLMLPQRELLLILGPKSQFSVKHLIQTQTFISSWAYYCPQDDAPPQPFCF